MAWIGETHEDAAEGRSRTRTRASCARWDA